MLFLVWVRILNDTEDPEPEKKCVWVADLVCQGNRPGCSCVLARRPGDLFKFEEESTRVGVTSKVVGLFLGWPRLSYSSGCCLYYADDDDDDDAVRTWERPSG